MYEEFVKKHVDVVFPFESLVLEPKEDWSWNSNSPYSKDDMKARLCPCVVAVSKAAQDSSWEDRFSFWAASDAPGVLRIFFGDDEDAVYEAKRKWLMS